MTSHESRAGVEIEKRRAGDTQGRGWVGKQEGVPEYWPGEVSLCREGGNLSWWLVLELVAVAVDCPD